MVGDVLRKSEMLQQTGHDMMPGAVKAWEADDHQGKDGTHPEAQGDRCKIDPQPDTGDKKHLRRLIFCNIGPLVRMQAPCHMHKHTPQQLQRVDDAEQIEHDFQEIRRAHCNDFRIPSHDNGVGVMPDVAGAPDDRIADQHEAGDLIDDGVHPGRLEGSPVSAFVPSGIRRRAVEHAIDKPEGRRPPGRPQPDRHATGHGHQTEPEHGVAQCNGVRLFSQTPDLPGINLGPIPGGIGEPLLYGHPCRLADERIVLRHSETLIQVARAVYFYNVRTRQVAEEAIFKSHRQRHLSAQNAAQQPSHDSDFEADAPYSVRKLRL